MTTPEEIRRNDLERDRLLQVNRSLPSRTRPVVVIEQPNAVHARIRGIAERGHEEYGCGRPDGWCAFCELLEVVAKG